MQFDLILSLAAHLPAVLGSALPAHAGLSARAVTSSAADECGVLEVMPVPAGEDAAHYRKCLRHPLEGVDLSELEHARRPTDEPSELESPPDDGAPDWILKAITKREDAPGHLFGKRDCYYWEGYGCSRRWGGNQKYCWKRCGVVYELGFWCWTAADGGGGPWLSCTIAAQCNPLRVSASCGGDCSC